MRLCNILDSVIRIVGLVKSISKSKRHKLRGGILKSKLDPTSLMDLKLASKSNI